MSDSKVNRKTMRNRALPLYPDATLEAVERSSLLRLFWLYLRVASLTFGGGFPTMAAIHAEMVTARQWLSREKYATVYALARITPGTNLLAFCAGTGWEVLGWPGAIAAVLATNVPGGIAVMLLTQGYDAAHANRSAMAAVASMLAAAVGIMGMAAWELLWPFFNRRQWIPTVVIGGASLLLFSVFALPPIAILGLAAATGLTWRISE
jgi:chromate transporter